MPDARNGARFIADYLKARGVTHVFFMDAILRRSLIEMDKGAADQIKKNLTTLGSSQGQVIQSDAVSWLQGPATPFDLVFLDPPYFSKLIPPTLLSLKAGGWIAEDGIVIIEHDEKEKVEIPDSFTRVDERKYGRAIVELLKIVQ